MEGNNVKQQQRRKRIMERGSDRLALITGQIKNLEESLTPTHSHSESSPSILFSPHRFDSDNVDPDQDADKAIEPKMSKLRTMNEFSNSRKHEELPSIQNSVRTPEKGTRVSETITKVEAANQLRLFSSKRLNYCIIISERTRAICSLAIALLVILSHTNFPLFGMSILAFRPFYTILLTDVTVVLARLFRDGENFIDEDDKEETTGSNEDRDNWEEAFKLLEKGLVMYQAIRGLFIDCSIYAVMVICGLCLI